MILTLLQGSLTTSIALGDGSQLRPRLWLIVETGRAEGFVNAMFGWQLRNRQSLRPIAVADVNLTARGAPR
jgi:hypothetical protein